MPRRREVPKRDILPDPKFGNVDVSKFVNTIMKSGKKSVAERIVYGAFDQIVTKTGKDPLEVFGLALGNIKPLVEVKSRRVGGANYQVPVEVRPSRRMALAMRWLRESARKRSEKSMGQRLAAEMLEASESAAVRSRSVTKCTAWPKPTRHSRTSGSRSTSALLPRRLTIVLY
jgi:small subunit ribosomal protein S7